MDRFVEKAMGFFKGFVVTDYTATKRNAFDHGMGDFANHSHLR